MKRMNFINKQTAQKQQQLSRWFLFSSLSMCTVIMGIIIFQTLELLELHTAKTTLASSQTHLDALQLSCQEKQILENKKTSLSTMRSHIFSCTLSPCNPHDTLCLLNKLSKLPINLQSVQLHQDGLELTAYAQNIQHATTSIAQLKEASSFKSIELLSISPGQKGLLLKIRGNNKS